MADVGGGESLGQHTAVEIPAHHVTVVPGVLDREPTGPAPVEALADLYARSVLKRLIVRIRHRCVSQRLRRADGKRLGYEARRTSRTVASNKDPSSAESVQRTSTAVLVMLGANLNVVSNGVNSLPCPVKM